MKKKDYDVVLKPRNMIGPLEMMMHEHQRKVVKKIRTQEEELTGGKQSKPKSSRLMSMRSKGLVKGVGGGASNLNKSSQQKVDTFSSVAQKALDKVDEKSKPGGSHHGETDLQRTRSGSVSAAHHDDHHHHHHDHNRSSKEELIRCMIKKR